MLNFTYQVLLLLCILCILPAALSGVVLFGSSWGFLLGIVPCLLAAFICPRIDAQIGLQH